MIRTFTLTEVIYPVKDGAMYETAAQELSLRGFRLHKKQVVSNI